MKLLKSLVSDLHSLDDPIRASHSARFFKTGIGQYGAGDKFLGLNTPQKIYDFYLAHTTRFNNWDLVDISAPHIVGLYLVDKDRSILYRLAQSANLWEKRISVISTFAFIRQGDLDDTFKVCQILLSDPHDLIHKAVGWMLREAGKVDQTRLEKFLKDNYSRLPRTALRYAIEKFPEPKRKRFLHLKIV